MNTKKALLVIMILLILMNIALAAYIIVISTGSKENAGSLVYTESILKQRNIEINCTIPDEAPAPSSVILGDMLYSDEVFDNLISKTGGSYSIDDRGRLIFISDSEDVKITGEMSRTAVEMAAREFIENIGLQKDEFVLDLYIGTGKNEYNVRYMNKDSLGVYYYDSYIEMTVTENGVVGAEIHVREVKEKISKKGTSLPVYTVLLTNLVSETKTKAINGISFGYHLKNQFTNEALMSFRVSFDDGSERFFDVFSGDEITLEIDALEFNNIIFKCRMPEPFNGYSNITYSDSMLNFLDGNLIESFEDGQVSINDNYVFTYIKTNYSDLTKYDLSDETINKIASDFISGLGLNPAMFYQDSKLQNEDESYKLSYIYKDTGDEFHFDNYINLHLNDLGVMLATIRVNNYTFDSTFEENQSIGSVLLKKLDLSYGKVYTVLAIDSGYKRVTPDSLNTVACWRVTFEDDSKRFFSVKTGEELFWDNQ